MAKNLVAVVKGDQFDPEQTLKNLADRMAAFNTELGSVISEGTVTPFLIEPDEKRRLRDEYVKLEKLFKSDPDRISGRGRGITWNVAEVQQLLSDSLRDDRGLPENARFMKIAMQYNNNHPEIGFSFQPATIANALKPGKDGKPAKLKAVPSPSKTEPVENGELAAV